MNTARLPFFFVVAFLACLLLPQAASAQPGERACTMQYDPVCGAKQVQCITAPCYPQYQTYGNQCTMGNDDGAIFIHKGECTPEESGPVKNPPTATSTPTFTPPESCRTWFDGCNSCARMNGDQAACTKRFCSEPKAGYCTSYDVGKPGSSSPDQYHSTSTTSSIPVEERKDFKPFSFLMRGWLHLLSWLRF